MAPPMGKIVLYRKKLMTTKVDNILSNLGLERPANINNNTYITYITDNNNITDILTTSMFAVDSNPKQDQLTSSSLGLASLSASQPSSPCSDAVALPKEKGIKKLPAAWRGVKFDLFRNGLNKSGTDTLKLNISIIENTNGRCVPLMAALNSDFDSAVRRGVDAELWSDSAHWRAVRQLRRQLQEIYVDVRASKVSLKNKAGGTEMVVFVYKDRANVWCVDYVREGEIYQFDLTDAVTEAQAEKKIIATGYHGLKKQKLITAKELGV
jgi:hypothetical protein